jgi:hypothetical protein
MNELEKLIRANKIYNSMDGIYSEEEFHDAGDYLCKFHDKYKTINPSEFKKLLK